MTVSVNQPKNMTPEKLIEHLRALRELMLEGKTEDAIEWCDIAIRNLLRHGDLVAEECDH